MSQDAEQKRSVYPEPDASTAPPGGVNHLLVIGIDVYKDERIPALHNACADAKAIKNVLSEQYGFGGECKELYDAQATRKHIYKALDHFMENAREDDCLLIYFAGHGYYRKTSKKGYLVPSDAELGDYDTLISNTELLDDYLPHIPVRHLILVVDSCFSGSLFSLRRNLHFISGEYQEKHIREMMTGRSRLGIAAGRIESVSDGLVGNHSPFAHSLLKVLRDNQQPYLPAYDLFPLVKKMTTVESDQQPIYGVLANSAHEEGFQYVFRLTDLPDRHWQQARSADSLPGWLEYIRRYRLLDYEPENQRVLHALERLEALAEKPSGDPAELKRLKTQIGSLQADIARLNKEKAALAESHAADAEQAQARLAAEGTLRQQLQARLETLLADLEKETSRRTQAEAGQQQAQDQIQILTRERDQLQARLDEAHRAGGEAYQRAARQAWNSYFSRAASKAELERFLSWFPEGSFADEARTQLERLTRLSVPEMVLIRGGTFEMGDVLGDNENKHEKPVHKVTLSDFYIGKYAVTFEQYDAYCEATGTEKPGDAGWSRGDRPVINVSWDDAQGYCRWLQEQTGHVWRLPTEAEWEYAAREGGKKVRFGNGKEVADPSQMNFDASKEYKKAYSVKGEYRKRTVPVGSFAPNGLGLYNMSGNVWEWCADWYGDYPAEAQTDPQGPPQGSYRVLRGGGWAADAQYCRTAYRYRGTPSTRNFGVGFRLVFVP